MDEKILTPKISIEESIDCIKNFKTIEDIENGFDVDDICMKCPNIKYKDGVISCKYVRVN